MSLNLSDGREEESAPERLIFEDRMAFMDFVKRQKKTQFWMPVHKHGTSEYHSSLPVPRKSVLLWVECCLPGNENFRVRLSLSESIIGEGRKTVFIHPF